MHEIDLRRADLNLLTVFDTLMAERHVGRAAARLGKTQSATSHALGRLRLMFDDPLFIRHPKGISPTPHAVALEASVSDLLGRARQMLATNGAFDPATSTDVFRIGATDHAILVVLKPLLAWMRGHAPGMDLRVRSLDRAGIVEAFDRQEIDLALAFFDTPPHRIERQPLLQEHFVGLARRQHPCFDQPMTAEAFAALPHLLVSPSGGAMGIADEALARIGLSRRVVMTVPHFLCAPALIAGTDLVTLLAARVARALGTGLDLQLFAPPIDMPSFTIDLLWSRSRSQERALGWLRATIVSLTTSPELDLKSRDATLP